MASDPDKPEKSEQQWTMSLVLAILVVVLGSLNSVTRQIATVPLQEYTYILSLTDATVKLPIYAALFAVYRRKGDIPDYQLDFMWYRKLFKGLPMSFVFMLSSIADVLGLVIGIICSPYVAGPVQTLLNSGTTVFIALLSLFFAGKRYSFAQSSSLILIIIAVIVGGIPSFTTSGSTGVSTNPSFAGIYLASDIFPAMSFVIQELIFARYTRWQSTEGLVGCGSGDQQGLHIFLVSLTQSIFSLPFTLLSIPLNEVMGQTHGKGIMTYLSEAIGCVLWGSCGPNSVGADLSGVAVLSYIVTNNLWNLSILASVKLSGALSTFVCLKFIFPLSTLLFAYVDWPLLGRTPVPDLVWVSIAILLPTTMYFRHASTNQDRRYPGHTGWKPGETLCCWPLLNLKSTPEDMADPMVRRSSWHPGHALMDKELFACPYAKCPDSRQVKGVPCATQTLFARSHTTPLGVA